MKTLYSYVEMIREWAQDTSRKIEFRSRNEVHWTDIEEPMWSTKCEYRFKPEPKPDYKVYAQLLSIPFQIYLEREPNIEFTFDGETGKLKDARVLK